MAVDSTYNLCTLAELKAFIVPDKTYPIESAHDTALEATIDTVSKWFHEATHRQLKALALTEYYDGDGTKNLYLKSWPVVSATFYVDNDLEFGAATEVTPELIRDNECIYTSRWVKGYGNIKVTYTGGYSTIPNDLKGAALIMCSVMWDRQKNGSHDSEALAILGNTVNFVPERLAPPYVMDVINKYKRVVY